MLFCTGHETACPTVKTGFIVSDSERNNSLLSLPHRLLLRSISHRPDRISIHHSSSFHPPRFSHFARLVSRSELHHLVIIEIGINSIGFGEISNHGLLFITIELRFLNILSVLDEHEGHDPNTRPRMELPGSVGD